MKARILLILFCLTALSSQAQSYTLNPGPSVSGAVTPGDFLFLNIEMVNAGSDTIHLEYALLSNISNPNWDITLCDYQSCYPVLPMSGAMAPVAAGGYGFLKVDVFPNSDLGSGQVIYKVWEASNPNDADTLIFNFDVITATQQAAPKPLVAVYPNPASDLVNIETGTPMHGAGTFTLHAADGKVVGKADMPSNGSLSYPVSDLPTGIYLVRVVDRDHDLKARIVIE
jgi:hypothetical protein